MRIPKLLEVPLAQWLHISKYEPQMGDFVIRHGWFIHYFGFITKIQDSTVTIVKSGLPTLLLSMPPEEVEKNSIEVPITKIHRSRHEFAILQNNIWYL